MSRYSHTATSKEEKDKWIRKVPLLVLIYEGIVAGVFDYDYAPFSEVNINAFTFNVTVLFPHSYVDHDHLGAWPEESVYEYKSRRERRYWWLEGSRMDQWP